MVHPKSDYRPDIDGLRAVAILGVLIFHICPQWLGGGYVGVDVFFVISGYLITGILKRNLEAGNFSFGGFYERRLRRIFPALFVMIAAVMIVGGTFLFPAEFEGMANSVKKIVMGLANFHFLKETAGYFNHEAAEMPLLHTWSLAVEEQFYFVFPLLMWALYARIKQPIARTVVLTVLFVASLAVSIHLVPQHALKAFYLPHSRAWELLLGALVALHGSFFVPAGKFWSRGGGFVGFLLIGGSMVMFGPRTPFPGAMALIPCAGAALIILAGGHSGGGIAQVLAWKPVVLLGRISYSVYLWHWPLLFLFHHRYPSLPWLPVWVLSGSLILGWLSWRWVERPFRNLEFLSRRQVYLLWVVLSALLIAGATVIRKKDGFPERFSPQVLHYLAYGKQPRRFNNSAAERYDVVNAQVYGEKSAVPTLAIWGDSHAEALMPLMSRMAKSSGVAIKFFGSRGNPPVPGTAFITDPKAPQEEAYKQTVLENILADASLKTVILHCRWASPYLGTNEGNNNRELGFYGQLLPDQQAVQDYYIDRVRHVIDTLLAGGKRVVIVYPVPEVGIDVPIHLAKKSLSGGPVPTTVPFPGYFTRNEAILRLFDSLPENDRIAKIRPADKMLHDGRLMILSNDEPLYQDDDHMSEAGALFLEDLFSGVFKKD